MSNDDAKVLEAGRKYLAAEKAFELAKLELDQACTERGRSDVHGNLPLFIWDNGRLYQMHYERSERPTIREIRHDMILVVPTAG